MTKQEMMDEVERLHAEGKFLEAEQMWEKARWTCSCGKEAYEQFDCYGIYAGRHCDACFRRKYKSSYDRYADGYSAPGEGFFD